MTTAENNVAPQASDEPMLSLDERRAEHEAEAVRINAGRTPKFGDWMRNPWAGESNPHRDGMFVRSGRNTGRCNPGPWYEFTDGKGEFWQMSTKSVFFIDTPRATADVERLRSALSDLIEVAERCDSWQSFPAAPPNAARAALENVPVAADVERDAARWRYWRKQYGAECRMIPGAIMYADSPEKLDIAVDLCMPDIATTKPGA